MVFQHDITAPTHKNIRNELFPSLHTDLGEDAGGGSHSAVHHAVEDGEQAVQGKRLRPQEVVTRLQKGQNV